MELERVIESINRNYKIKNILHLGAHLGGEVDFYDKLNPESIYWFEANPELIDGLKTNLEKYPNLNQTIFPYAASSKNEKLNFNLIYSNDQTNTGCSSLKELEYHTVQYPHIQKIKTVEVEAVNVGEYLTANNHITDFELINMDIQGAEWDVLSTTECLFSNTLPFQMFVLEASEIEMYKGMKLEPELTAFMESKGFKKHFFQQMHYNWGDMLYVKNIN